MKTIKLGDIFPELDPHPGQREVLEDRHRFKVLACGRRWGKTQLALIEAVLHIISKPGCMVWIVSPTVSQQDAVWEKAMRVYDVEHKLFGGRFIRRYNSAVGRRKMVFYNGSKLFFKSGWLPETLRGAGDTLEYAIFDEAAYIREEAWNVVRFALEDRQGSAVLISTPNKEDPFNWFYQKFLQGLDEIEVPCEECGGTGCKKCDNKGTVLIPNPNKKENYRSWQFSTYDNPHMPPESIATMIEEEGWTAVDVQREVYANFVESAGALFPLEVIDAAMKGEFEEPVPGEEYVIGVDFGKIEDYTVVTVLKVSEARVVYIEAFQGGWYYQVEKIAQIYQRYFRPLTVVDATSGGTILDMLRDAGVTRLVPYHFGGHNKAKLVDSFRAAIEQGQIILPRHKKLRQELLYYQAKKLPSGTLQYGPPKNKHDDHVDSLFLAWHGYLMRKRGGGPRGFVFKVFGKSR